MVVSVAEALLNSDENLGKDIRLSSDNDIVIGSQDDFGVVTYLDNAAQAIVNRFRTNVAELTLHPLYGCRLPRMIGDPSRENTLSLVKMHVRDALLQEPRVAEILTIRPRFEDAARQIISVEVEVTVIQSNNKLNLVYKLFL